MLNTYVYFISTGKGRDGNVLVAEKGLKMKNETQAIDYITYF